MIRQPAIAAGLAFEADPESKQTLDEVLADEVKAEPRLLPLLEFALDELYNHRSGQGFLTFAAFRQHLDASIVRALAKRADFTLEGLPEASRDAFRSVMRRLATTVDETGSVKGPHLDVTEKGSSGPGFQRQRVPYDQLTAYPPGAKTLVDAFVAVRLLVVETGETDDQKAEVTVAHEALFEHWTALRNLLQADRDDLILPRARVAASHKRWRAENRASDFLLPPGKQLSEAEQLLAEYGEELTPELKAYVAASMAQAHAQQKRRHRLLVGAVLVFALLAVAATAAAIFGFLQKGKAESQEADNADSFSKLAFVYDQKGDYAKAEPLLQQALEIRKRLSGPKQPDTASSLDSLALLYDHMGNYAKAEPLFQQALQIRMKMLGAEHPDTAASLDNLALLYDHMGDYPKAEPLLRQALEIRRKVFGPERPDTATSLDNLALLYDHVGDYAKAEALFQQALQIRETVLGREHPDSATSLNDLALLYDHMGDYTRAEPLLKEALTIREKVLAHPDTATSLDNLALLYDHMGDYVKAEPLFEQALQIRKTVLGPEHPNTALSLNRLAILYSHMGDYAKAEALFQQALQIRINALNSV